MKSTDTLIVRILNLFLSTPIGTPVSTSALNKLSASSTGRSHVHKELSMLIRKNIVVHLDSAQWLLCDVDAAKALLEQKKAVRDPLSTIDMLVLAHLDAHGDSHVSALYGAAPHAAPTFLRNKLTAMFQSGVVDRPFPGVYRLSSFGRHKLEQARQDSAALHAA